MLVSRALHLSRLMNLRRHVHSGAKAPKRIKELQERFQIDDGVPVYLKGGTIDRVMFALIMGLCGIGTCMSVGVIYEYAYPKK